MATDTPLTLSRAHVVRPEEVSTVDDWLSEVDSEYRMQHPSTERGLAEFLFAQTGHQARSVCTGANSSALRQFPGFRRARQQSQADLAGQALDALISSLSSEDAIKRCEVAVFTGASLDDSTMFQSLATRLADKVGLIKLPHFSVAQLQGAALAGATEIIEAMVANQDSAAVCIAAERWPVSFPRSWGNMTLLGDGAVALWFERTNQTGLQYLGSAQRSYDPFIRMPGVDINDLTPQTDDFADAMDRYRLDDNREGAAADAILEVSVPSLVAATVEVIQACLSDYGLSASDIGGWIPSGISPELEEVIRDQVGVSVPLAVQPQKDDGYWCSAAAPAMMAEVLGQLSAGYISDGTIFLSWGASLGGSASAQLWRATTGSGV
ncbi:MAG: hypothetical protein AAF449_13080 [Myxococcota bacterium]